MPILGESDDEEADEGVSIEYAVVPGSLSGEAEDGDEDDDEDDEVGGGTA